MAHVYMDIPVKYLLKNQYPVQRYKETRCIVFSHKGGFEQIDWYPEVMSPEAGSYSYFLIYFNK
jgi:hypothetical protein